jgi:hypothetical protein
MVAKEEKAAVQRNEEKAKQAALERLRNLLALAKGKVTVVNTLRNFCTTHVDIYVAICYTISVQHAVFFYCEFVGAKGRKARVPWETCPGRATDPIQKQRAGITPRPEAACRKRLSRKRLSLLRV